MNILQGVKVKSCKSREGRKGGTVCSAGIANGLTTLGSKPDNSKVQRSHQLAVMLLFSFKSVTSMSIKKCPRIVPNFTYSRRDTWILRR